MTRVEDESYNAAEDLLERNGVAGRVERPYLITDRETYSYGQVIARARTFGAGLIAAGLAPGDRVVLVANESYEWVCAFWGAMRAGMIPLPVSPLTAADDLRFIIRDSGCTVVIFDQIGAAVVGSLDLDTVLPIAIAGGNVRNARPWADVSADASRLAAHTTARDIAFGLYTSGTTGTPKAALHKHGSLRATPHGIASQVLHMTVTDRVLSVPRAFGAYGLSASVYLPAGAGSAVILHEGGDNPYLVQQAIEKHEPTLLFATPPFYIGYMRLGNARLGASVRAAMSSGDTLSSDLFHIFRARFGMPLLDGLGTTEAMGHFASSRLDDAIAGSVGRPLEGWEIELRDPDGNALPPGRSGELWVRGPTVMASYWGQPALTGRMLVDGWLRTGDIVRITDGRILFMGRIDDLMKLGGTWVAPREIEEILRNHPDVDDAAVAISGNARNVPLLKAVIQSQRADVAFHRELRQACASKLASFKVPRIFETVEMLPRTMSGKIQRFELRSEGPREIYAGKPGMMIVLFKAGVVKDRDETRGLLAHLSRYSDIRAEVEGGGITQVHITGKTAQLSRTAMEQLPGVKRVVTMSEKHRLLGRRPDETSPGFVYNGVQFDQDTFHLFAGLCAVDTPEHVEQTMKALQGVGLTTTRMGAYKPRTSPYDFQGLELECLPYVFELAGKYGIRVIAMEVLHERHIEEIRGALALAGNPTGVMLQIGTRNAQNFELLKHAGEQSDFPVLYKRGMGVTIDESLSACEYIASSGQPNIVFCLRGVKTHLSEPHRNLVDFAQVPVVKRLTTMPVCIDPSHSIGKKDFGADGLSEIFHATAQGLIVGANMALVDFHPVPSRAVCDGPQALTLDELNPFLEDVQLVRDAYLKRRELSLARARKL